MPSCAGVGTRQSTRSNPGEAVKCGYGPGRQAGLAPASAHARTRVILRDQLLPDGGLARTAAGPPRISIPPICLFRGKSKAGPRRSRGRLGAPEPGDGA
jgi:hypothetical protein